MSKPITADQLKDKINKILNYCIIHLSSLGKHWYINIMKVTTKINVDEIKKRD